MRAQWRQHGAPLFAEQRQPNLIQHPAPQSKINRNSLAHTFHRDIFFYIVEPYHNGAAVLYKVEYAHHGLGHACGGKGYNNVFYRPSACVKVFGNPAEGEG